MAYLYLLVAIVGEVIGTSALKASESFTRPMPSVITVVSYAVTFYFLALVLKTIPVGIAYAVWAAVGIVLIAAFGYVWFRQPLDGPAIAGITLIIAGVVIIHAFSNSIPH